MKKPHLHECGLACKLKFVDPLDLAHHYLVGHHSPALVERDGFLYCGECFDVFKDTQKSQYDTHVKHGKHLVCPKDKRAFPSANKISYEFHIKQNHSLQCHECALSFLPADRLLFDKHKDTHKMDKVSEVKSEPDKMEPCLVDEFLVEEKEAKSRVPRLDTDSGKVTCEAMAEKVKYEVVATDEEDEENNVSALANFKSRVVRETQKVKKSLKVIMNKVSLVKMATFVKATKELHLVTIPDNQ